MAARTGNRSLHQYLAQRGEPASYAQLHTVMLTQIVKSPDFRIPEEMPTGELLSTLQATLAHTTLQDPTLLHIGAGERSIESGRWFFQPEALDNLQAPPASIPLADNVEMDVVQTLQEHPGCTSLQVDQAICVKYPGVWTPEAELISACLGSYAESPPENPTAWVLREQDTPSIRRADLRELDLLLEQIGIRAGFSIRRTPPLGISLRPAILWSKANSPPDFLFYIHRLCCTQPTHLPGRSVSKYAPTGSTATTHLDPAGWALKLDPIQNRA